MFRRLAVLSERFAWPVVALWLVAGIALTLTAPSLEEVGTQDTAEFLPSDAPSQQADQLLQRLFPNDPTRDSAILVFSRRGTLTEADRAYVASVSEYLRSPSGGTAVKQVQTVATSPELAPFLRAPDGGAELMIVGLNAPPFSAPVNRFVEGLRQHFEGTAPPGLSTHVTGIAGLATDQANAITESFDRTAIVSVLLVLLILCLIFRSAVTPFIPLLTIGFGFLVARGLIGFMAGAGVNVSSQVETFMVVMIFGAGTDYCLFAVARYREELQRGDPIPATLRRAMTAVGAVIAASAGTVIVGFASQVTARSGIYKTMGPSIGLAIFVTLVASLTLAPALLRIAGRAAFWPGRLDAQQSGEAATARWERVAARVKQRPAVVLLAGVIILQIPAAGMGWFEQSFDLVNELPPDAGARQGFEALSEHFPGGTLSPIYLVIATHEGIVADDRLAAVDKLTDELRSLPGVGEVRSVTQPAGAPLTIETAERFGLSAGGVGQSTAGFGIDPNQVDVTPLFNAMASPSGLRFTGPVLRAYPQIKERLRFLIGQDDRSTRLILALDGNPYANEALDTFRRIDDAAAASLAGGPLAGARLAVGGPTSFYVDLRAAGNEDFRLITAVLLGGIFIVLALLLRSIVAPFYLLATVVLSYLATMGIAVTVFQSIGGAEGLSFWLPPMLFIILVALGADYNIFIMSRIREEADAGHEIHEAAARGLVLTGGVITSAGLILAGTFAALMLAPLPNMRQIGFAVTLGVLIDTFIVRTLLVPSATMLLGRWAFWPSSIGQERIPVRRRHVGLAGAGVAAFAAALIAIAVAGNPDTPVSRVSATARDTGLVTEPSAPLSPESTSPDAAATPQPTSPTGQNPRSSPTPSPSTTTAAGLTPQASTTTQNRVAIPSAGDWRYDVEGTRKIGAAGSTQPFAEDVVTKVARTGGTEAAEVRLSTDSGQGSQEETRRYTPDVVELLSIKQSSGGMGFGGTFSTPQPLIRWPIRIGDTWTTDWTTGGVSGRTTSKVLGVRSITAAGRSHRCFDVRSDSTFTGDAQGEQHQTTCWIVELGMSADTNSEYRGTYNGVAFDFRQRALLTATP